MEIKEYIVKLYNVRSKEGSGCMQSCDLNKRCVCLDSEQAGIISKMLDDTDAVSINFNEDKEYFYNASFEYSSYKKSCLDKELCLDKKKMYMSYINLI